MCRYYLQSGAHYKRKRNEQQSKTQCCTHTQCSAAGSIVANWKTALEKLLRARKANSGAVIIVNQSILRGEEDGDVTRSGRGITPTLLGSLALPVSHLEAKRNVIGPLWIQSTARSTNGLSVLLFAKGLSWSVVSWVSYFILIVLSPLVFSLF